MERAKAAVNASRKAGARARPKAAGAAAASVPGSSGVAGESGEINMVINPAMLAKRSGDSTGVNDLEQVWKEEEEGACVRG